MPSTPAALVLVACAACAAARRTRYSLPQDGWPLKDSAEEQPAALAREDSAEEQLAALAGEEQSPAIAAQPQAPHYWSGRGGNDRMNSDVSWTAPVDFSHGPSWTWINPMGEQVRHSPLIDRDSNIYIATVTSIRKFSRTGTLLWTWRSPTVDQGTGGDSEMVASPVLHGDAILALARSPTTVILHSLSLATGAVNWWREHAVTQAGDSSAMLVYSNKTLVFAVRDWAKLSPPLLVDANRKVFAVDATDGNHLWDFAMDGMVWNFAPSTPGDGTLVFATTCGAAYRLDFDGRLRWKSAGREKPDDMCGAGGGAMGPDDVFYVSYKDGNSFLGTPGNQFAALRLSDGIVLWKTTILFGDGHGGAQYPAVGRLGKQGPLAVVAAVGDQPLVEGMAEKNGLNPNQTQRNAVVALDAATGKQLWLSEELPWPHVVAAGDENRNAMIRQKHFPNLGAACWPDNQGIPVIAGDGTVYASSSHSGDLRALHSFEKNGTIGVADKSTFHPGICFLNSPSVAPGMLVAAPCWGPTYVFLGAA